MGRLSEILISRIEQYHYSRFGSRYIIETPKNIFYNIFVYDSVILYRKSTDGITWASPVQVSAANTGSNAGYLSIYYDRYANISAGLIHIVFVDKNSDVIYRNIDTDNSDTLSASVTIFNGTSADANGYVSIVRTRGGDLICGGCIDAGTESFFKKSTDTGANWSDITTAYEATQDQLILMPDWNNADLNDCTCFYWDASANEISVKRYDQSANNWAETLIASSMTDVTIGTDGPYFSAVSDILNAQNILIAWSARDTANADLRCWTITESVITEVTNVILNSADDQGMCVISIDNFNNLYVFYVGKSDGTETFRSSVNIYYKISKDMGATWGAEIILTIQNQDLYSLTSSMLIYSKFMLSYVKLYSYDGLTSYNLVNITDNAIPRTTYQLGM